MGNGQYGGDNYSQVAWGPPINKLEDSPFSPTPKKSNFDHHNPLLILRQYLGVSQNHLAELCSTSEQYLRRAEQGLVSHPIDRIAQLAWAYDTSRNKEELALLVRQKIVDLEQESSLSAPDHLRKMRFESSPHGFEKFINSWYSYWLLCKRHNIITFPAPTSLYEFCRRLGVHIYIVQHYVRRRSGNRDQPVPPALREAIYQTPMSDVWMNYLEAFVEEKRGA